MLQESFSSFIKQEELIYPGQKNLLAVSGGIDSVVMTYLFYLSELKLQFAIAHCNFKLRNKESDKDEEFVKNLAEELSVPFYKETFNIFEHSGKTSDSVQMAARALRYEWLHEVCKNKGYNLIATAHHHDDNIETLLINLLRGTGIHGLQGIPVKNKNIIRPILFAKKQEIEQFAEKHNLSYREDQSNKENKYLRNIIRNKVVPVFKEINPEFRNNFKQFFENIKLPYQCFLKYIEDNKKELLIKDNERQLIPLKKLKQLEYCENILYELLKNYGFNANTIKDMVASIDKQPGKLFFGNGYVIIKDREYFILFPEQKNKNKIIYIINKPQQYNLPDLKLITKAFDITDNLILNKTRLCANLDFDKLQFPLTLRPWQKGDIFQPLGMQGKKKVSDFLIDEKISIDQKDKIFVLCSGEKIAWIVGHRIDERFKINKNSKRCFYITAIFDDNN